jgi:hypothetical protein
MGPFTEDQLIVITGASGFWRLRCEQVSRETGERLAWLTDAAGRNRDVQVQ